jgi:predicted 3-demethylubiquinone-9 3-methyltransferase (glyoxalase superfamily)
MPKIIPCPWFGDAEAQECGWLKDRYVIAGHIMPNRHEGDAHTLRAGPNQPRHASVRDMKEIDTKSL